MDDLDPQLVADARRGDLRAFEALVRRYQPAVWRMSSHLLADTSLAEDVTQEVFVRVYRFLPSYRGDSKFSTWLFAIARNCAMDELRRPQRRERAQDPDVELEDPHNESVGVEVRDALMRLPVRTREPLVWIDMFGMPYAEAARLMGIPIGTLKSRVHYARTLLAEALTAPGRSRSHEA